MNVPRLFLVPGAAAAVLLVLSPFAARAADPAESDASSSVRPTQAEIDAEPGNLSGGLRQLAAAARKSTRVHAPGPRARAALSAHRRATASRVVEDAAGRVVVDVRLRPGADLVTARAALEALGAEVIAESSHGRPGDGGTISVRLAPEHAATAAGQSGVHSLSLIRKPWRRVGRTTSQGAAKINSGAVNALGITGRGITVGVLSDSYNLVSPNAAADVASGDLPGRGNPAGRTTPVVVLNEATRDSGGADEGRAMLQIVHDVAPDANLVFSTTGDTQTSFANNIRALRTVAGCDVLVDDIGFPDEPFFSDSVVANAVDEVVTSISLPGPRVAFYSAAGNEGGIGYESDFVPVTDAEVRAPGSIIAGNLRLDQVPAILTGGGFHNFKRVLKGQGRGVVQKVVISNDTSEFDLQWNDRPNAITNDYKLLIFDADGNYLADLSDTSNAFESGDVYKFTDLDPNPDGSERTYQIAITKRTGSNGPANHFRYLVYTNGFIQSKYLQSNVPTIFGHSGARQVDAVGAVPYNEDQRISEDYSSLGPVTIYFDDNGNRLTTPETRFQPTIAAPDNVNTTFFPDGNADSDNDGFPNFGGTSAAAPHAAGAAALLLQAAGGPGSLSSGSLRSLLTATAGLHDVTPFTTTAALSDGGDARVSLVAQGDGTNSSSYSTRFFSLSFDAGPVGSELRSLSIDLAPTKEIFDPNTDLGFGFAVGAVANGVNAAGVTFTLANSAAVGAAPNTLLTLTFAPGAFPRGGILRFGIDRDDAQAKAGGNSADLIEGAVVKVKSTGEGNVGKLRYKGTLQNDYGTAYSTAVGAGLINVQAAVDRLQGR